MSNVYGSVEAACMITTNAFAATTWLICAYYTHGVRG